MKNIKKIIEYGLYLLVFILPVHARWIIKAGELNGGYWEYGTMGLYATDILLIVLLLLFTVQSLNRKNYKSKITNSKKITNPKLQIQNYWWLIGLLELFIFISIFFAADKVLAIYKYGVFLLGVGLFWLIVSANYNKMKLIFGLLAGILLQAVFGIWQFLTQATFSSKWLGMAAHRAGELGTSVIEVIGADGFGERWLRAYGGLDHPNVLGGVLAIGLLLVILNEVNLSKKRKIFNFQFSIFKQFSIFNYLIISIFILGLFFSFSRAAWLGFVIGLIIMFVSLLWKKNLTGQKKFLELVLIGGVIVFLLFNLYGDLAKTRLQGGTRLEEKSYVERISSMREAKEIIKDKWLFGAGMGNYTLEVYNNEEKHRPSFYFQPAHNVFLLIWAEIGLLGLLGFLGVLGVLGWRIVKSRTGFYGLSVLAALIIIMLVDHWLWSLHFGMLFFWLIMGLLLKEEIRSKM